MTSPLRDNHPLSFPCALAIYWVGVGIAALLGGAFVAFMKGG